MDSSSKLSQGASYEGIPELCPATPKITALIPTYNCEETLRDCLESAKWADELLVVDSYSTDCTLDIAREYSARILQHEYITSAKQKNWAMGYVTTDWVLQLDSDEVVEPALKAEILAALDSSSLFDGYRIPRKNLVWGRWIRASNYYPDYQLRLFRGAHGRWNDREVHAHVEGLKSVSTLRSCLIHYDITSVRKELHQFARQVLEWEFHELAKKGKHWHWRDVTLRPLAIFILYYGVNKGFREGFRGFYLSAYRAFYSFMTYARLYEEEVRLGLRR